MSNIKRRFLTLPVSLLVLMGCATYERRPLELEQYVRDWSLREISVDSIRKYAATLADSEENVPYDPSDGLSLVEAEAIALVFNPQLRLARAQAEVPLAKCARGRLVAGSRVRSQGPALRGSRIASKVPFRRTVVRRRQHRHHRC